jgi:zinc/manganese transport system substrate-binding protein
VAQVIDLGRARKVRVLLQEAWFPTTTSSVAAEKMGARLVVIPGMANFHAGQSYPAFLAGIAKQLEGAK